MIDEIVIGAVRALLAGCAIYLGYRCWDRVRLVNWHTVQPLFVLLYLAGLLSNIGVLYCCTIDAPLWPLMPGMVGLYCVLEVTKQNWAHGVPEAARSRPAPLGRPEPKETM